MKRFRSLVFAFVLASLTLPPQGGGVHAQMGARSVVDAAAAAIGGANTIRAVRNVTLVGYGQYAYQFGGGRITGDPSAPEKYIAANDLRRVYDLEHNRFRLTERRNMLFPFLGPFGHNWSLVSQTLDGDIAYDIDGDRSARVARETESPLQVDGIHVRRMLMMTNPLVLIRTLMDPATRMSAPRREGGANVIDVTLKDGDRFSVAFAATRLPAWIRWSTRHTNVG